MSCIHPFSGYWAQGPVVSCRVGLKAIMSLSDSDMIAWVSDRVGLQLQHTANEEQTAPLLIEVSSFWFSE